MSADLPFWRQRYQEQAGWTRHVRINLLNMAGLPTGRLLEVGCGTGAVLDSIAISHPLFSLFGLDIDFPSLTYLPQHRPVCADGYALPYRSGAFSICCCHYLLLWLQQPIVVLREMLRVLSPGGILAVFAEPDYQARIDYPPAAAAIGQQQNRSLISQSARLDVGRQVGPLLRSLGLQDVFSGVIGAEWPDQTSRDSLETTVLRKDLEYIGEQSSEPTKDGAEVLFIPTFFASGRKPRDF